MAGMKEEYGICSPFLVRIPLICHRKFPKARVWPPLPGSSHFSKNEEDFGISMPDQNMQDHLMDLYWTHVHPALPILHKQLFLESLQRGCAFSPHCHFPFSVSNDTVVPPLIRPILEAPKLPVRPTPVVPRAMCLLCCYSQCSRSPLDTHRLQSLSHRKARCGLPEMCI